VLQVYGAHNKTFGGAKLTPFFIFPISHFHFREGMTRARGMREGFVEAVSKKKKIKRWQSFTCMAIVI
jgi:hypothetical protein